MNDEPRPLYLSAYRLYMRGACPEGIALFRRTFGTDPVFLTRENLLKAAKAGLDIHWLLDTWWRDGPSLYTINPYPKARVERRYRMREAAGDLRAWAIRKRDRGRFCDSRYVSMMPFPQKRFETLWEGIEYERRNPLGPRRRLP